MAYITHCLYHMWACRWNLAVNPFCNIAPTLGVTLPIRRGIGVRMYEWSRWMYCFNQKGTSCRHRVVAWKVETWPIGLERIKTHPPVTFPLYYPPWYLINWGEYSAAVTSEQRELLLSSPSLLSDSFFQDYLFKSKSHYQFDCYSVVCLGFGFFDNVQDYT